MTTMTTPDEARAARRAVARSIPDEWFDLVSAMTEEAKAFDDAVESKAIRYVRSAEGSRKYGEPIGAPIKPNAPKLSYVRNGPKKRNATPIAAPSGDKRYGSDKEVAKEITRLTNVRVRSSAEQSRLDSLIGERKRRTNAPATAAPSPSNAANAEKLSSLSDDDLRSEIRKVAKKRRLTIKDRARDAALVAEFNRREGDSARSQARRLIGKSDTTFDFTWTRLLVDAKAFDLVGDGDWDCSHMTDDDVDFFLVKCLSGRPTVEKLQQADALLAERASRVDAAFTEVKELTWEPKA